MRYVFAILIVLFAGCKDFPEGVSIKMELTSGQKYSCDDACIEIDEGIVWGADDISVYCWDNRTPTKINISKKSIKYMIVDTTNRVSSQDSTAGSCINYSGRRR